MRVSHSTVIDTAFGQTDAFKEVMSHVNTFYLDTLAQIRKRIDAKVLEFDADAFEQQRSANKLAPKEAVLVARVAMAWQALSAQCGDEECVGAGDAECAALQRLWFVMRLYREHLLGAVVYDEKKKTGVDYVSLFEAALRGYDCVRLLDDFEHLKLRHDAKELQPLKNCAREGADSECCHVLLRQFREARSEHKSDDAQPAASLSPFEAYVRGLDGAQRTLIEVSSKLHTFLNHRDDDDEIEDLDALNQVIRRRRSQRKRLSASPSAEQHSKFVMEALQQQSVEKEEQGHIDGIAAILSKLGLHIDDEHSEAFVRRLALEAYDTDAVLLDVLDPNDEYNNYASSNLFSWLECSKYAMKRIKQHLGAAHRDDDKLGEFAFGFARFYYWRCDEDQPAYNVLKYYSLKDECVNNKIYAIGLEQFDEFLVKAHLYAQSWRARSIISEDEGSLNTWYETPSGLPISTAHLMSLLMYCNDTTLQYEFKKQGCRESVPLQSVRDPEFAKWKARNAEIGHWYKLLLEAVEMFGTFATAKDVFFTGLGARLL